MNKKGFTLVELMGVIAILAVLILIAVPAVGSLLQRNKDRIAEQTRKELKDAAVTYAIEKEYLKKCKNDFEAKDFSSFDSLSSEYNDCWTTIKVSKLLGDDESEDEEDKVPYFRDSRGDCNPDDEIILYRYVHVDSATGDVTDEIRAVLDEYTCTDAQDGD